MKKIEAIIFDFDGLILDTETPIYQAWKQIYGEYDAELPLSEWVKCVGASDDYFDPCGYLEKQCSITLNRTEMRTRHLEIYGRYLENQHLLPGVMDYLEYAEINGIRLAVASSSSLRWVEGHLKKLGIRTYFETVVCSDHVDLVKPSPDLFLKALNNLGVDASAAVVLEDSLNGIRAARKAGIFCIAVPNQITSCLDFKEADIVASSLVSMPLSELLKIFAA